MGFNLPGELRKMRATNSVELSDLESIKESVGLNAEQTLRKVLTAARSGGILLAC